MLTALFLYDQRVNDYVYNKMMGYVKMERETKRIIEEYDARFPAILSGFVRRMNRKAYVFSHIKYNNELLSFNIEKADMSSTVCGIVRILPDINICENVILNLFDFAVELFSVELESNPILRLIPKIKSLDMREMRLVVPIPDSETRSDEPLPIYQSDLLIARSTMWAYGEKEGALFDETTFDVSGERVFLKRET